MTEEHNSKDLTSISKKLDEILLDLRGDKHRGHKGFKGRMEDVEHRLSEVEDNIESRISDVEEHTYQQDRRIAAYSGVMGAVGGAIGFVGAVLAGFLRSFFG